MAGADTTPPAVTLISPPNGTIGAPINTQIVAMLSEEIDPSSVGAGSITVANGASVPGAITLSSDRRVLTFVASVPLATSTLHTVSIGGFADFSGNVAQVSQSVFTTSASSVADTTRPQVSSIAPASGAAGVPVSTTIQWTFTEPVDPTTVDADSMPVSVDGFSGVVAGTYAVNGAVVTFTPLNPFPGNARIRAQVNTQVRDFANNAALTFFPFFDTAAVADSTPPEVTMITPTDGATDIGPNTPVVLTFSESLNANTINNTNFELFVNGDRQFPSVSRSADNRTITLNRSLPAGATASVIVTDDVQDLSGNPLADFRSDFTTAPVFDAVRPSVVTQRPSNGASNVSPEARVTLFMNEAMDAASIQGGLFVSQDGQLVTGTASLLGDGRTIEFVPDAPFSQNALVQVFLTTTATDTSGNQAFNHQSSFRVIDTVETPPFVSRVHTPFPFPLNGDILLEFNESLDPVTVNSTTVPFFQNVSGTPNISANVTLENEGLTIRVSPTVDLAANSTYFVQTTSGIQDLSGTPAAGLSNWFITTQETADNAPPQLLSVSPPDQSADIGVNALVRLRFNEPINPLTATESTIQISDGSASAPACTISFANNNQGVTITPHTPFPVNAILQITVDGVEDDAANSVAVQTAEFTTRSGPDLESPLFTRSNPSQSGQNVPVNTVVVIEANEPLDPGSIHADSVFLFDSSVGQVGADVSLSGDGTRIFVVPDAPLTVSQNHQVFSFSNVFDLSGNGFGFNVFFTTAASADLTAPQVLSLNPPDGSMGVATNSRVQVLFDEPVQSFGSDGVDLLAGGSEVATVKTFSNGNRTLTLTPTVLLQATTGYEVEVGAVQDVADNALASPATAVFSTESGVDLLRPTLTDTTPVNGTTGIAVGAAVLFMFSEPMNPVTVNADSIRLEQLPSGTIVPGTVTLSVDGLTAAFTPDEDLLPLTNYRLRVFTTATDVAGNSYSGSSVPASFTTGAN